MATPFRPTFLAPLLTPLLALAAAAGRALADDFKTWAPTPPMCWNSWDCYGDSVTEAEVFSNAQFMADRLTKLGWKYVVVDIRWTVQNPGTRPYNQTDPVFAVNQHGRFLPAPNRFPSAADGQGFKPLAGKVHDLGL